MRRCELKMQSCEKKQQLVIKDRTSGGIHFCVKLKFVPCVVALCNVFGSPHVR